jgi:hypothetical protein
MLRTLPADPAEPPLYAHRRIFAALRAVAALRPRDEIEMMLAVQAVSAYYAASAGWRLNMNHHRPNGDSTRHAAMAASAVRTFDSLLKALERRQAKPLPASANRQWTQQDLALFVETWADRCRGHEAVPAEHETMPVWPPTALRIASELREQKNECELAAGADIDSILPGGVVPENPTLLQQAVIGQRLGHAIRRAYEENQRKGVQEMPKIPILRTGDPVP